MQRFRRTIDTLQLAELHLTGRLFTWSNEISRPTMERIDRVFAMVPWLESHPFHNLHCRSTDHAPLLLVLSMEPWVQPWFRFEAFWPIVDGFLEVVAAAWICPFTGVDACRALDYKLRSVAKALKSWGAQRMAVFAFSWLRRGWSFMS